MANDDGLNLLVAKLIDAIKLHGEHVKLVDSASISRMVTSQDEVSRAYQDAGTLYENQTRHLAYKTIFKNKLASRLLEAINVFPETVAIWEALPPQGRITAARLMGKELHGAWMQHVKVPVVKDVIQSGFTAQSHTSLGAELPLRGPKRAQDIAQRVAAALEQYEQHFPAKPTLHIPTDTARVKLTQKALASLHKRIRKDFDTGVQHAGENNGAFAGQVRGYLALEFERKPALKGIWNKKALQNFVSDHLGEELTNIIHRVHSPHIEAQVAAYANAVERAASTQSPPHKPKTVSAAEAVLERAGRSAVAAGATVAKTAEQLSGKEKLLLAGTGAAVVALGAAAVMHTSHAARAKENKRQVVDTMLDR